MVTIFTTPCSSRRIEDKLLFMKKGSLERIGFNV